MTEHFSANTARPKRTFHWALFDYGFRPFFLLAALEAALAIPVWLLAYRGDLAAPDGFPPSIWHAHEMLYGFAAAVIAGFMLTAVPNWTGAAPMRGRSLAALAGLWLLGRILMWRPELAPIWLATLVDLAFVPALAMAVAPALLARAAARNRAFLLVLAILVAGNAMIDLSRFGMALADAHKGVLLALDTLVLLITIIGGRIVPSFTANAVRRGDPSFEIATPRALDHGAVGLTILLIPLDLLGQDALLGVAALAAAAGHVARLATWRSHRTIGQPILWVLHLGYAWLPIGLMLRGGAALTDAIPASAGIHALTVGAVGTMTLAVMSRAALGHTGHALRAAPLTVIAYVLVTLAAVARVVGASLAGEPQLWALELSGCAWSLGFALFLVVYAPILIRSRDDDRPG